MFRINLKRSVATVAVLAGALAVAGPANASSTPLQNTMVSGFIESQYVPTAIEFMDYTDDALLD